MAKRRRRRTHRVRPDRCREGLRAAPQLWSKPFPLLFLPLMGGWSGCTLASGPASHPAWSLGLLVGAPAILRGPGHLAP